MKQRIISIALSALTLYSGAMAKNTIENIDRGVVALPASQGGIFLSWRLLANDTDSVKKLQQTSSPQTLKTRKERVLLFTPLSLNNEVLRNRHKP